MGTTGRYENLKKALIMLTYLCEHRFGATIPELAEELAITKRSVYRYLQVFRQLEIPIATVHSESHPKRFKLINRPQMAELLGII